LRPGETESVDTDRDGIGNNSDTDDDNDGVDDSVDAYPLDASRSVAEEEGGSSNPSQNPVTTTGGGGGGCSLAGSAVPGSVNHILMMGTFMGLVAIRRRIRKNA
jgi:hypothetical protein